VRQHIEVGYQAFVSDGGEEFGAVRQVRPNGELVLVVYVENGGDFLVPLDAVVSVHDGRLRRAIGHAHDAEEPSL
jgi:hypothetical protein